MSVAPTLTHADADTLAAGVAARLVLRLQEVQQVAGRVPQVVLTGGTIARKIHASVAASPLRDTVVWTEVEFWWGDERFVPADDPERNERQAREDFLDALAADPARVHAVASSDDAADVEAAALAYAEQLAAHAGPGRTTPAFDVVMLGVGPDGHVASLFPGQGTTAVTDRTVIPVHDSPKPPPLRVSMTVPTLVDTDQLWFLVSGEGKAEAVRRAFEDHDVPAAEVHGREQTLWLLDTDAASALAPR